MAKKPTHYDLKINRSVEVANIMFKPDAEYTVTAEIYDKIKEAAADAVTSAVPLIME